MLDSATLIAAFTTLFVIIDPPGLAPIFLTLTRGMSRARRQVIALRACLIAAGILFAFALFGEALLGFIGISIPAFRIAGGILLFITALDMLFERRQTRRKSQVDESGDPSTFPLAVPLMAGPGAIATIILLAGQTSDAASFAGIILVMVAVLFLSFVAFSAAGFLEWLLGDTGLTILSRLLGLLLAALAMQFILDGFAAFGLIQHAAGQ